MLQEVEKLKRLDQSSLNCRFICSGHTLRIFSLDRKCFIVFKTCCGAKVNNINNKYLPADKKVHGWVEVLVLHYCRDDHDVFQQWDDPQDQKHLRREHAETGSMGKEMLHQVRGRHGFTGSTFPGPDTNLHSNVDLLTGCGFEGGGLVLQQRRGGGVVLVIVGEGPGGVTQQLLLLVHRRVHPVHRCWTLNNSHSICTPFLGRTWHR